MRIKFFIPHTVQAKQGDRSRIVDVVKNGNPVFDKKGKRKQYIQHYTDSKVTKNASALCSLCEPHVPPQPLKGAVRLVLKVQYRWRVSEPKKNRDRPRTKYTSPDSEQIVKQYCDVFESMGFVANDAQFGEVHVRREWTDSPGVDVVMEEIE